MLGGTLGFLPEGEVAARLARGLTLQTPPFVTTIKSRNRTLSPMLHHLYGGYLIADGEVADFEVGLEAPTRLRRFWRAQVMADIYTQAPFSPLPAAMAPLMMEQSLNWMVATRDFTHLVLHAAVVEKDGRALLMPGESAQGKSTLCAALVSRGWRLLSDEFALVDPETGLIHPYPRPVSLKNQSIEVIRNFAPGEEFSAALSGTPKGRIAYMKPPANALAHAETPARPVAVLTPQYHPEAEARLEELAPPALFMFLTACSVNYKIFGEAGYRLISGLVERTIARIIHYADLEAAVSMAGDLLEQAE